MSNDYSFMIKSDNDSFYNLFNYVINTNSYYRYRNSGFNNLNVSIFQTSSFEEVYLLLKVIKIKYKNAVNKAEASIYHLGICLCLSK